MRRKLAQLTSNILNPFVISFIIITLLAFKETSDIVDAIKWSVISLVVSVLPVFIIVIYRVNQKKMDGFFSTPKEQRNIIYLIASVLGAIGCGLLWFLNAPEFLQFTFTAGLISIIVFMWINHYWKISLHTAFTTASVVVLIIIYGAIAAWVLVFIPLVAWARIEMKQHSIAQVGVGGLLAALIILGIFWGFGIVWS